MNLYETTFIVNPQSDDAVIEEKVKAISDLILANGGKIVHEDRMGTRRLAYPINKLHQGYYATFLHESDKSVLPLLDRHMKLGEEYMRHLTIRFEADPERVYGDKKEDYRAPRQFQKNKPVSTAASTAKADSGSETAEIKIVPAAVTETADSGSETAEIKIVPATDTETADSGSETAEIKIVPATVAETADSQSETAEIKIVPATDEAEAEEKKPADEKPEDEEL